MNTKLVDHYCHDALNFNVDMYRADWYGETEKPAEPLKFKPYRELERFVLETPVPVTLGDVRLAFVQPGGAPSSDSNSVLNSARLSALLFY
jgi:hypothetical protein